MEGGRYIDGLMRNDASGGRGVVDLSPSTPLKTASGLFLRIEGGIRRPTLLGLICEEMGMADPKFLVQHTFFHRRVQATARPALVSVSGCVDLHNCEKKVKRSRLTFQSVEFHSLSQSTCGCRMTAPVLGAPVFNA